jgi:hypothetical protein
MVRSFGFCQLPVCKTERSVSIIQKHGRKHSPALLYLKLIVSFHNEESAMLETGFPRADVENDFLRARRHQALAALAYRLRRQPPGGDRLLPLDEVTGPLGWRGERYLGLQTIRLDTIVGTTGSRRDFDRHFRPASNRMQDRWELLALAQRRGAAIPPIEVYRVGGQHFVSDGHHRVSIAAATGQHAIDAYVTEILTGPAAATGTRPTLVPSCARARLGGGVGDGGRDFRSCLSRSGPGFLRGGRV